MSANLPPKLRMLVNAVGYDAALRVAEAFGGLSVHIPAKPGGKLAAVLSHDELAALCAGDLGGQTIDHMPMTKKLLVAARNAEIRAQYRPPKIGRPGRGGNEVWALVREYGLSQRWIREIARDSGREDSRQISFL